MNNELKGKVSTVLALALCLGCLTACKDAQSTQEISAQAATLESSTSLGENMKNYSLFPTTENSFVGDPMPFFDKGKFHVFYLEDLRDGTTGYHPWSLYDTSDFTDYKYKGKAIPFGDDIKDQDIALGTGSVIKAKDGTYHAFYTGHNDTYEPKEAIMHATSKDMKKWTKQPNDTFYAGDNYAKNDFRDPYVLYDKDEEQYWMLVSTRNEKTGVLAKYTSKDLKTWKDEGVFFENDLGSDSNLECSSLVKYKGKWYLAFSDQWPNKQVHYRVSDKKSGPFEKPKTETFDGNGFYAGRLETDGKNLYVFGWNPTKNQHVDSEEYNWGGNLVVHQLKQDGKGHLHPILNEAIDDKLSKQLELTPLLMTKTVKKDENSYAFAGKEYEVVKFEKLLGSYKLEATFKDFKKNGKFGFTFDMNDDATGNLNVVFDVKNKRIDFYNTNEIYKEDPQTSVDFDFDGVDKVKVRALISDGVVSFYVNGNCALTTRMYQSQGTEWGIFGIKSDFTCEDVNIYK